MFSPEPVGRLSGRGSLPGDIGIGLALFACGLGYGVWSVWLVPVRLPGGIEGLSLAVTVVGNLLAGLLAGWGLRSRRAPLWPVAGWFFATAAFALVVGPGGDIVVPGGLPADPGVVKVGEYDWLAGLLSAAVVLVIAGRQWGITRHRRRPELRR